MALDADNVFIALTGAIYVAPTGTTLPTDSTSALDGAFVDLGYVTEDGVVLSRDDEGGDPVRAWQNGDTLRTKPVTSTWTAAVTCLELKVKVLELYFGATATSGGGGVSIDIGDPDLTRRAVVIDALDGNTLTRYVFAAAAVTEITELPLTHTDETGYGLTFTAYSPSGGGAPGALYTTALSA